MQQTDTPIHLMVAAGVHAGFTVERVDVGQQLAYVVSPDGHQQVFGVNDDLQVRNLLARLAPIVNHLGEQSDDYEGFECAFNAFCELAELAMTGKQADQWEAWNLKATGREIVDEALRILGITAA